MPEVQVTQDPIAVIVIVAVMGMLVVVSIAFSIWAARVPQAPELSEGRAQPDQPVPSASTAGTDQTSDPPDIPRSMLLDESD